MKRNRSVLLRALLPLFVLLGLGGLLWLAHTWFLPQPDPHRHIDSLSALPRIGKTISGRKPPRLPHRKVMP